MLISVQAGNSDNKLTQREWSNFVTELTNILCRYQTAQHFFGGAPTWAPWQNVCFVCEVDSVSDELLSDLKACREKYKQDSVCLLAGNAQFV